MPLWDHEGLSATLVAVRLMSGQAHLPEHRATLSPNRVAEPDRTQFARPIVLLLNL